MTALTEERRRPARTYRADLKTTPRDDSPQQWIDSLPWPRRVAQGRELLRTFHKVTGAEPVMWGDSMVGYGDLHYRYDTGREGHVARVAFSPRKAAISLYGLQRGRDAHELLDRLGPHRRGVGCVYVTRLGALDQYVLRELVLRGWESDAAC